MEPQNLLILLAQEFEQSEYGLGWALTLGLIFLGILAVCIPRPRKALPKDLLAAEKAKAKKIKKKKKGAKKKSAKR